MSWAQLYEGSSHVPLPKGKHLGILLQGEVERTPCGWISQVDVCHLLSTGPQVVYPTGLNGHMEPIITTLPEPLSSGMSVIASEHSYLEINIPSNGESDTKVLPVGEVSIIPATNLHNPPSNPEGSITAEVNHLLDEAMGRSIPSQHGRGGRLPRGHPCHHIPNSCHSQQQKCQSLSGPIGASGQYQQSH